MTAPEVEWALDRISTYYGAGALAAGTTAAGEEVPLRLADRDESLLWEDESDAPDFSEALHRRQDEFGHANYVGVQLADYSTTAIGTEYDHAVEAVIGVRIEGMTAQGGRWGHVDPAGREGAPWQSIVWTIKRALQRDRRWPDVDRPDVTYTDAQFANEADASDEHKDYYRTDFDVILSGYEDLPG